MIEFNIYADGICCMSVCVSTPATKEEIEARANFINPTGITSGWRIADKPFRTGEPNPHPCERNRQTHQHYLLEC